MPLLWQSRWSTAGLRSHIRVHRVNANAKGSYFACHICSRTFKGKFVIMSHMRPHTCFLRGAFWRTKIDWGSSANTNKTISCITATVSVIGISCRSADFYQSSSNMDSVRVNQVFRWFVFSSDQLWSWES